jgi:hypothetical protein
VSTTSVYTHSRGWPDEGKGPLKITIHLAAINGRLECVGFLIGHLRDEIPDEGAPPGYLREPQPITASTFRGIPAGRLIDWTIGQIPRDDLVEWAASDPDAWLEGYRDMPAWAADALEALEQPGGGKRGGRPPIPFETLVEAAAVYRQAFATTSPRKAVAKHFSISDSQASKYITRARKEGLLPPTQRGRARA